MTISQRIQLLYNLFERANSRFSSDDYREAQIILAGLNSVQIVPDTFMYLKLSKSWLNRQLKLKRNKMI